MSASLPKGQRARTSFPRFGLTPFARRFPTVTDRINIDISGLVESPFCVDDAALAAVPRWEQTSDFHCVTTWSYQSLRWGGFRFRDVYEMLIAPHLRPGRPARVLIIKAQDGARTSLLVEDALADDVMLADQLDGAPLGIDHGAPIRLVAPSLYGYKSVKHVHRIELHSDESSFRPSAFRFMDHSRARVELEERGRFFPGWLLRMVYRPMVRSTVALFEREQKRFESRHD